jgi:S-DNA-T family DNA segregation ATPase FtsK/SpoIIIE
MREVAEPTFERSLMQIRTGAENGVGAEFAEGGGGGEDGERNGWNDAQQDPLFDQAVEVVLETKRGSVSMLQRRLAIGYTRAARLIELMGQCGILGSYKGTVAREVAMTIEEWHAMKAQAAADAAAKDAGEDGLSRGPDGMLNSHPSTGETLEAAQARINGKGGDGGVSPKKATDEIDGDEDSDELAGEIEDAADEGDQDDSGDEPPFEIKTRPTSPGRPSGV